VAIAGHIEIADNVTITGMSLVSHSVKEPGVYSSGVPLDTNQQWRKNAVRFKQLDEMAKRIKALESRLGK
jgi:UDP-3-O-[3-hydroxymyristoyl] glucosamine N-acyltransferase